MMGWLPVPGWECRYLVSSRGEVYSLLNRRLLAQRHDAYGYRLVNLSDPDRPHVTVKVHSLVLLAFRGPRPSRHECRHLNGVRDDNRLANLAWGTSAENKADMVSHGTRGRPNARLNEQAVKVIRYLRDRVPQWKLAAAYRSHQSSMSVIQLGKTWKGI